MDIHSGLKVTILDSTHMFPRPTLTWAEADEDTEALDENEVDAVTKAAAAPAVTSAVETTGTSAEEYEETEGGGGRRRIQGGEGGGGRVDFLIIRRRNLWNLRQMVRIGAAGI